MPRPNKKPSRRVLLGGALGVACALLGGPARADMLDLSALKMTFEEDFTHLSVSANGPGTTWTAHTPWHGDFGDAQFVDPTPGFPFNRAAGSFRIELRKGADGKWRSGLLATLDPAGAGFAQTFGYFEMRAKLPPGPGVWPAFWLATLAPKTSEDPGVEIDVLEYYGKFPANYNSTVTVWPNASASKPRSEMHINHVPEGALTRDFHTYGVMVEPAWITFYLDRVATWRVKTPPEHRHPLMILVDLGLGSGWPIDQTPNPSFMYIDYVRAYAPAAASAARR